MASSTFAVGDPVQTPLGKGTVRGSRRNGCLLVDVSGRAVVFEEGAVTPIDTRKGKPRRVVPAPAPAPQVDEVPPDSRVRRAAGEVDLHGLTVEEALAAAERAVNDALLGDLPQLRLIHGRSGGRIRAALHRRLRAIPTVRAFRLDPRNAGVTIVSF